LCAGIKRIPFSRPSIASTGTSSSSIQDWDPLRLVGTTFWSTAFLTVVSAMPLSSAASRRVINVRDMKLYLQVQD
jgi:hypothetical protein